MFSSRTEYRRTESAPSLDFCRLPPILEPRFLSDLDGTLRDEKLPLSTAGSCEPGQALTGAALSIRFRVWKGVAFRFSRPSGICRWPMIIPLAAKNETFTYSAPAIKSSTSSRAKSISTDVCSLRNAPPHSAPRGTFRRLQIAYKPDITAYSRRRRIPCWISSKVTAASLSASSFSRRSFQSAGSSSPASLPFLSRSR